MWVAEWCAGAIKWGGATRVRERGALGLSALGVQGLAGRKWG